MAAAVALEADQSHMCRGREPIGRGVGQNMSLGAHSSSSSLQAAQLVISWNELSCVAFIIQTNSMKAMQHELNCQMTTTRRP